MSAFVTAWKVSRYVPVPVIKGVAAAGAWLAWLAHGSVIHTLEGNLNRISGVEGRALRRMSRKAMASTARYYAETFELGRIDLSIIDARVRAINIQPQIEALEKDKHLVIVLGHSGNWDVAGAYTCRNIGPVTSVAEVLKPREVFDEFVAMREKVGMRILGHEGSSTYRRLVSIARHEPGVIALLADRDLTGEGVPVPFAGNRARVAPGPAALALASNCAIVPLAVHYERIYGARRKAAKSRWGIVMHFGPFVPIPTEGTKPEKVKAISAQWAQWIGEQVQAHPEDWHMLQRFGWVDEDVVGDASASEHALPSQGSDPAELNSRD